MPRRKIFLNYFGPAIAVISITAFGLWLGVTVSESELAQELVSGYGYVGIFILSVVSGFNVVFPVPTISFLPVFQAAGMNVPFAVALTIAGMTVGDMGGYMIGKTGKVILSSSNKKTLFYLDELKGRYKVGPLVALFLFVAFAPLPNEILVIPLGFLGYHLKHIFPIVLAGNAIFNTLAALGILGIFEGLK